MRPVEVAKLIIQETKQQENAIFKEAINGYGFEEIEQSVDGIYCKGCLCVHKRPTKMYHSDHVLITPVCKQAIVRFYNPAE